MRLLETLIVVVASAALVVAWHDSDSDSDSDSHGLTLREMATLDDDLGPTHRWYTANRKGWKGGRPKPPKPPKPTKPTKGPRYPQPEPTRRPWPTMPSGTCNLASCTLFCNGPGICDYTGNCQCPPAQPVPGQGGDPNTPPQFHG